MARFQLGEPGQLTPPLQAGCPHQYDGGWGWGWVTAHLRATVRPDKADAQAWWARDRAGSGHLSCNPRLMCQPSHHTAGGQQPQPADLAGLHVNTTPSPHEPQHMQL